MEIKVGDKVRVIATVWQLTKLNIPPSEAKLLCSATSTVAWCTGSVSVYVDGHTSWSMPKEFIAKQPIQLMLQFSEKSV